MNVVVPLCAFIVQQMTSGHDIPEQEYVSAEARLIGK